MFFYFRDIFCDGHCTCIVSTVSWYAICGVGDMQHLHGLPVAWTLTGLLAWSKCISTIALSNVPSPINKNTRNKQYNSLNKQYNTRNEQHNTRKKQYNTCNKQYNTHYEQYIHVTNSILHVTSSIIHITSSILHVPSSIIHVTSSILHVTSSIIYVTSSIIHVTSRVHKFFEMEIVNPPMLKQS